MSLLLTPFGVKLNTSHPLPEYPRPQLVRSSYLNLNGTWQYAILPAPKQDESSSSQTDNPAAAQLPTAWDGDILVPFSPESILSGVQKTLLPGQTLCYRRQATLPPAFIKSRVLLHFGAVDQCCAVYINGMKAGTHSGGFLPFHFDVTKLLRGSTLEIALMVEDPTDTSSHAHGRQRLQKGGSWHSAFSGIWQTVWMESVPKNYITTLRITPLYDEGAVDVELVGNIDSISGTLEVYARSTLSAHATFSASGTTRIPLPGALSWSPGRPFLYTLRVSAGEDNIESYFGMRKISTKIGEDGHPRIFLNNKPFFSTALLDQGMYSDGLATPPTDSAMIEDIKYARECGFNTLEKHGKIEPLRWYYHCDRLGMLVWQDLPAGGQEPKRGLFSQVFTRGSSPPDNHFNHYGRQSEAGRTSFLADMEATASLLYNTVSLGVWVLFQSGRGQFNAAKAAERMCQIDPTRLIDHAGGGPDQNAGHFRTVRISAKQPHLIQTNVPPQSTPPRALSVVSAGCIGLALPTNSAAPHPHARQMVQTPEELASALTNVYTSTLQPLLAQGLSAAVFSQLSDVEDEVFGLISYDRRVKKIASKTMAALNLLLTR